MLFIDSHPNTAPNIRGSIISGIVVIGMCPEEAVAAAGTRGPFTAQIDEKKWPDSVVTQIVWEAQCDDPDNSKFQVLFRNSRQFDIGDTFRVLIEKGKVIAIDQNEL